MSERQGLASRVVSVLALVAAGAATTLPTSALADTASDIRADLQASGAPVTAVAVETPPAASVPLDTMRSPSLAFADFRPYFSPDYAQPRPVARVTLGVGNGVPLGGILTTPGLPSRGFTDVQPKMVAWHLAAVEAIKHATADGAQLGALQLDVDTPDGTWRILQALPKTSIWPPSQGAATMNLEAVKTAVSRELPPWAQALTTLTVTDDADGERVVSARLSVLSVAFASHNVRAVTDSLARAQRSLVSQGAKIGRTLVTITDVASGDPLYTAGDDRLWGYSGEWISPRVEGLRGFQRLGGVATPDPVEAPSLPNSTPWTVSLTPAPQIPR